MKKNLIIIFLGLSFLTTSLIVGTPFEFMNPTIDKLVTIFLLLLITALFVYLFVLALRLERKIIKRITIGLICILAIPYSLTALWTTMLTRGDYHPMWEDLSIYTNKDGEKVISEWRETSGSIYDYRYRKIIRDFGQFRISLEWNRKKMKGLWTEYIIYTKRTQIIDIEKEEIIQTTEKNEATNP